MGQFSHLVNQGQLGRAQDGLHSGHALFTLTFNSDYTPICSPCPRSGAVAGALSVAAHGPRTRTARNAPKIPARLFQQRHRPLWSVRLLNNRRKGLSMARIPETEIMKRI